MLGKKNSLADGLSRWLLDGEQPNELEEDIKEFINYKLDTLEYTATLIKIETG